MKLLSTEWKAHSRHSIVADVSKSPPKKASLSCKQSKLYLETSQTVCPRRDVARRQIHMKSPYHMPNKRSNSTIPSHRQENIFIYMALPISLEIFLKLIWKCNLFVFLLKTTHWLENLATATHRHWSQHLSSSILCSPFCRSGLEERPGITSSFSQSSSISNTWLGIFSGLRDLLKIQRKLLSTRNTIHNHHQQTKAK